ncbi:MAG: hypothetical protein IPM55_03985 [Acidobacteria bacterium]|nr:hypothetical protein [Acidobacteriota bacterium]
MTFLVHVAGGGVGDGVGDGVGVGVGVGFGVAVKIAVSAGRRLTAEAAGQGHGDALQSGAVALFSDSAGYRVTAAKHSLIAFYRPFEWFGALLRKCQNSSNKTKELFGCWPRLRSSKSQPIGWNPENEIFQQFSLGSFAQSHCVPVRAESIPLSFHCHFHCRAPPNAVCFIRMDFKEM